MNSRPRLGGQAVLEGVMMRNRHQMVVACRKSRGGIVVHREEISLLSRRFAILRWPFIRGVVAFIEAITLAVKALNVSTRSAWEEEEGEELPPMYTFFTVVLGLALGVGLFFLLPTYAASFLPPLGSLTANFLEGLLRIFILVTYVFLIGRWSEIRRIFAYHGAEHKAIYCFEAGRDLCVSNAEQFSTKHPRCGTSFLLIVMVVSILLFTFFGWPGIWQRFLIRILMLPVVAAFSYELITLTARVSTQNPLRVLALPGLLLQGLTTREPDRSQLEVALEALKGLLPATEENTKEKDSPPSLTAGGETDVG